MVALELGISCDTQPFISFSNFHCSLYFGSMRGTHIAFCIYLVFRVLQPIHEVHASDQTTIALKSYQTISTSQLHWARLATVVRYKSLSSYHQSEAQACASLARSGDQTRRTSPLTSSFVLGLLIKQFEVDFLHSCGRSTRSCSAPAKQLRLLLPLPLGDNKHKLGHSASP